MNNEFEPIPDNPKQCSICKQRWHCLVDANGYTPCENGYESLADDKDGAKLLAESYRNCLAEYFNPHCLDTLIHTVKYYMIGWNRSNE